MNQDDIEIDDPDPNFQEVVNANKNHIFAEHSIGSMKSTYNFATKDFSSGYSEIAKHLETIAKELKYAFKIAIQPGFVLQSVAEPEKFRYFIPGSNENIMETPYQINKVTQTRQLVNKLKKIDIREHLKSQRPNSKYQVYYNTNFNYVVYPTNYILGYTLNKPRFIKEKKCVITLDINRKTGKPYKDKACFFRALCYHHHKKVKASVVKQYSKKWKSG